MTDKPQYEKLKIEKREPHWKPWVNSSAPEGWTYPDPPVVPEYITFTIRRMYIAQVQSNYRTFLQLIFIILTNSSYSSLKRKTGHRQDYINTHTHILLLYRVHLVRVEFELTTLVVIGTDCTGSCKSNYQMITTMTHIHLWSAKQDTSKTISTHTRTFCIAHL
jgi:hypothetical protein